MCHRGDNKFISIILQRGNYAFIKCGCQKEILWSIHLFVVEILKINSFYYFFDHSRAPSSCQICNIADFSRISGEGLSCVKRLFDTFRVQIDTIFLLSSAVWLACFQGNVVLKGWLDMYSICSRYCRNPNMEQRCCYVCVNRIKDNFDSPSRQSCWRLFWLSIGLMRLSKLM